MKITNIEDMAQRHLTCAEKLRDEAEKTHNFNDLRVACLNAATQHEWMATLSLLGHFFIQAAKEAK